MSLPVGVLFGAYAYLIIQAILWAQTSLQLGSIFTLVIITGLSAAGGALSRKLRLQQSDLLVVYIMTSLAACVSGVGMIPFLVNAMVAGRYYATPENDWEALIANLPPWFGPQNERLITAYYEGTYSLYRWNTLQEWAVPVIWWTAIILLVVTASVCLSNLLGRQWVERERLTFPLVQLPLQMTDTRPAAPFWRSRYMWAGFLLAGLLESVNFINYLCPEVPTVWLKGRRVDQFLTAPPWNGMRPLTVGFFPFMIGIGFLLTVETSLSCWLFYLVSKFENVACIAMGLRGATGSAWARLPMVHEQGAGAMLALMFAALWIARKPIWAALRGEGDASGDRTSFLSARASTTGLALALGGLTLMLSAAGLHAAIAGAFFVLYLLMVLAISRVVAETGAGWTMVGGNNPHRLLINLLGAGRFTPRGLSIHAFMYWLDGDYRDAPIVHLLAALKMRREARLSGRALLTAVGLALVVGTIAAWWAHLHIFYTYGAATAKVRNWYTSVGRIPFNYLANWTAYRPPPDWPSVGATLFGGLIAIGLGLARQRIPGWPLHPIGFAIAHTASMDYLWMPFLIAWLAKSLVLKYAGIKTYQRLVPFFLGLILGDFTIPGAWGLYGTLIGKRMYLFFPH